MFSDAPMGRPIISVDKPNPFVGETIVFTCHSDGVDANPTPNGSIWYKNDIEICNLSDSLLLYITVSAEDDGNYSCQVANSLGSSSMSDSVMMSSEEISKYSNQTHYSLIEG